MEQIVVWAVPAAALFFSLLFFILSKVLYRSHLQKFDTYTALFVSLVFFYIVYELVG